VCCPVQCHHERLLDVSQKLPRSGSLVAASGSATHLGTPAQLPTSPWPCCWENVLHLLYSTSKHCSCKPAQPSLYDAGKRFSGSSGGGCLLLLLLIAVPRSSTDTVCGAYRNSVWGSIWRSAGCPQAWHGSQLREGGMDLLL
jgi:hypothetical protein